MHVVPAGCSCDFLFIFGPFCSIAESCIFKVVSSLCPLMARELMFGLDMRAQLDVAPLVFVMLMIIPGYTRLLFS